MKDKDIEVRRMIAADKGVLVAKLVVVRCPSTVY